MRKFAQILVVASSLAIGFAATSCRSLGQVSAQTPIHDFSYATTVAINVGPASAPKLDVLSDSIKKTLLEAHVFDAVVDADQADVILNVDVRSAEHGNDLMVQMGAGGEGKVSVGVTLIDAKTSAELARFTVDADSKQGSDFRINGVNTHVVDDRVGQAFEKAGATISDALREARAQQPARKHVAPAAPTDTPETPDPLELEKKEEAANPNPAVARDVQGVTRTSTDNDGGALALERPWPHGVGIARRDQCAFRCIEHGEPVDSTKERHLEAWVEKQLGATRFCAISSSEFHPTNFYATFNAGGYLRFSIDVTAGRDSMQQCVSRIPAPGSATGPAFARWKCTDYCE